MIRIGICDDSREDIKKLQEYAEWFSGEHTEIPLKTEAFTSPYDLLQAISEHVGEPFRPMVVASIRGSSFSAS